MTGKEMLERLLGGLLLIATLPLMVAVGVAVGIVHGWPIFFSQRRPGLHGRPFVMYKFRTMTNRVNTAGEPLDDQQRLTALGRFLRASSLDELPELLNVVRGEMSLVGPRPLLMQYLDRYTPEQARRHEVKPGITGWAQVNGRNALSWEEKFALDVWYVDHRSLRLDCRILLLTIAKVLHRQGISREGHATMPEFMGTAAPRGSRAGRPGGPDTP